MSAGFNRPFPTVTDIRGTRSARVVLKFGHAAILVSSRHSTLGPQPLRRSDGGSGCRWPAIAQRRHTLIAAPTGSGKTLTAFLTCIDQLVRQGMETGLPDGTQVVYVSPLKALSNDIQKNLATPLEEIAALAEETGTPLPQITTAVRTGDTPASERQKLAKRPPHILITTPESLYILLTSESGRRGAEARQDADPG